MAGAGTRGSVAGDVFAIGAADLRLIAEPLDYLETENYRVRALLSLLARIGSEPRAGSRFAIAHLAINFILSDLARHVLDEDEGLFPLLRIRCGSADGLERILEMVSKEPARDAAECLAIVSELETVRIDRTIGDSLRVALKRFIESQRRVLALEDTIVLPLARRRLTDSDRSCLSRNIRDRRS